MTLVDGTYTYFSRADFDHPDRLSGTELIAMLDRGRAASGIPWVITSDFRLREDAPDPAKDSAHFYGLAVDIRCDNARDRFLIVSGARAAGFRRIGVYDKHVHVDIAGPEDGDGFSTDLLWIGVSR